MTKVLNLMEGDWYDTNGNRVLQIAGGYINGCRVLAAYDFAGASANGVGCFDILESTGSLRSISAGTSGTRTRTASS
ncbi:hypothetical protein TAMA11512_00870 [Selenomonas sp. TAMA-11512]|uniref:hypothetical protein n=1 Tax=Selenomonas sp. TAMA-11512 TaxID=3095337 RepID=UPI003090E686|nr:hypothetical protein TAMA11512_00870 [Selenomonas sp. TAMA-11512]